MASPAAAPSVITIDVSKDLTDVSQLKSLLQANQKAILSIGSELARFADQPARAAVGSKPAQIKIQAPATWKTSPGISFSLSPSASCTISMSDSSSKFSIAKSIGSSDTQDISAGPTTGKVYVNTEFDFDIKGQVSGSGSAMGIGIAGKASGSGSATLVFCHPVDADMLAVDAIRETLSHLVFPFEPACALSMAVGDIGKVNFDGSLGFEVDVTYGFGSYKFSAPGVDSARQSLQVGVEKLTLPTIDIETGAKAAFTYTHSDHFGAIVSKPDAPTALLYLVRSATNETGASVGVTVGISESGNLSASMDKTALAQAVNKITVTGGEKVAGIADELQSSLVSKANEWLSNEKGEAGLIVQLSKQTNRALLFTFSVDLSKADLAQKSWAKFSDGNLVEAIAYGGMTLLPGSGVGTELKRSVSIELHFFNLFKLQDTTTYFQDSYTEIGPDGSVRFLFDIGKEKETDTKKAMQKSRLHFVASASSTARDNVQNAEIDFYIELSETNKPVEANKIADSIGSLPANADIQAAQSAMRQFIASNKAGTLSLVSILKPSAYQKLACSQYTGIKHDLPPALPQEQDMDNWEAFLDSTETLLQLSYVSGLSYLGWEQFNLICNGKTSGIPDRRHPGNSSNVPSSFFGNAQNMKDLVTYFYSSSAQFMNLCDDLHALAGAIGEINTEVQSDDLLINLTLLVKNDANTDWSKPAARALLQLCSGVGATATIQSASKSKSLTCTVMVS